MQNVREKIRDVESRSSTMLSNKTFHDEKNVHSLLSNIVATSHR